MKAYIITQQDIDKFIELYNLKTEIIKTAPPYDIRDNELWPQAVEQARKTFQYYFLTFLQEQASSGGGT